jgi:hypothetical protein
MKKNRNGESIWWGEAPERPGDWTRAAGGLSPNGVDTPNHVPSRGLALHHGSDFASASPAADFRPKQATPDKSARFQAYRHHPAKIISCSDSAVRPFGNLAPPGVSPTRPFAVSPP